MKTSASEDQCPDPFELIYEKGFSSPAFRRKFRTAMILKSLTKQTCPPRFRLKAFKRNFERDDSEILTNKQDLFPMIPPEGGTTKRFSAAFQREKAS
jgi:hypothetical protein